MAHFLLTARAFAMFIILVGACSPKPEKEVETSTSPVTEANELPDFILIGADGSQFSARTLPGKTLLIFFSADCDHCQREATQIQRNLKAFDGYMLYFISMDPFPVIAKFAATYKINNLRNIAFVRADGGMVFRAMGNMKTPTICIFNGSKKLVKRFDGETRIEEILKFL
jgi:peroxiredoxin